METKDELFCIEIGEDIIEAIRSCVPIENHWAISKNTLDEKAYIVKKLRKYLQEKNNGFSLDIDRR